MRDYSNMPKIEWNDDKAILAKINTQLMREEPVIVLMPPGLNFTLDSAACGCREESGILTDCRGNTTLTHLAKQNDISALQEIGEFAEKAGLTVDVDPAQGHLIIHD